MNELHLALASASTDDMRSILVKNQFDTELRLTINLLVAALWHVDYRDLSKLCGISEDAVRAIQEMSMKEVAKLHIDHP